MVRAVYRIHRHEKGQEFLEVGLILGLVAAVIVSGVILFRRDIADSYCGLAYAVSPDAQNTFCKSPVVTCEVRSWSASSFALEAHVVDPDAAPNTLDSLERLAFYVNGEPWTGSAGDAPDHFRNQCFPHTDGVCETISLEPGTKITAVAYDRDGNSGDCSVRVP